MDRGSLIDHSKMETLSQFLSRYRTGISNYTHLSYHSPKAYYNIPASETGKLWELYCKDGGINLGERVTEFCPVRVDISLVFETYQEEPYDDDFLMSVIHCYQQAACKLFTTNSFGSRYCCVLQPSDDLIQAQGQNWVCRLALHFPYLRIAPQQHLSFLRKEAISLLRSLNTISLLPQQPIGDWEVIIDRPTDVLPFYGSRQTPDEPELTLSRIYDWITQEHINSEGPEREISDIFIPRSHLLVRRGLLEVDNDTDTWLPLLMSIDYDDKIGTSIISSPVEPSPETTEESITDTAQRFLTLLSDDRLREDHTWTDIGRALYNIHKGSEDGLDAWRKLAKRINRPVEDCNAYYDFATSNYLSIKTLAWFAKLDNPYEYERWHRSWFLPEFEKALDCSHTSVVGAIYRYFWLDYVCAGATNNLWYRYADHRWVEDDDATAFKYDIAYKFANEFEHFRTEISREIQESTDANFKRGKEELLKRINSLLMKLRNLTYKSALVREAKMLFLKREFLTIIDTDPAILGVSNGVIHLTPNYATFRPGKPEDFLTRFSPVCYHPTLSMTDPLVIKLNEWIGQMFPDKELQSYALRLFASCLYGKNSNKIFPVLTGSGDNSKSMLKKLFEATLGPSYCATVPNTLLTGRKTSSSAPNPELAQLACTRIAFVQEPDGNDAIKGGVLKELTGGDSFYARLLHRNGGAVTAMFTLMLLCNKIPVIPNADNAVFNRLRVLPFLSTWTDDAPKDKAEQYRLRRFPKDRNFEVQIPQLAPAFLWLLVKQYGDYRSQGLVIPEIIERHTNQYWQDNDPILLFWAEMIEEAYLPGREPKSIPDPDDPTKTILDKSQAVRDNQAYLQWGTVYTNYKNWFKEHYPGVTPQSSAAVRPEFIRRFGPLNSLNRWYGYTFKGENVDGTPR